ncbi:hypothetical protein MNV49_004938 [Pseudohyphozyma bogoriensis]|nr:hypothetical protein MNV49_004938 [Pseudohyphozyma bogoriensis]
MSYFLLLLGIDALLPSVLGAAATHCDATSFVPTFPSDALSVPAGDTPNFVAVGRGVQNYTCSNATWTSIGAVASLYDVSCYDSSTYADLVTSALSIPTSTTKRSERHLFAPRFGPQGNNHRSSPPPNSHHGGQPSGTANSTTAAAATTTPTTTTNVLDPSALLGLHTFVTVNGTLTPKFDFTASQHDASAYVLATKTATVNSPDNSTSDVAWLQLTAEEGSLASTVFRIDTAGGQPPSSCAVEGDQLSVQYAALYVFESSGSQ